MAEVLTETDSAGVRLLEFNRPEALNAFNQELWYALTDALDDAAGDDDVRCVLITGAGRAFSAGQDLGEMSDPSVYESSEPGYERLMPTLETFPKPLIAAVNGVAVGIGTTILLHCDMVIISTEARLRVPFMSLGVTTEAAASLLLPLTVGRQRAAEIVYTEPWLDAHGAVADGLALRAVEPSDLLEQATALATRVAEAPLASLVATKQLFNSSRLDAVREARTAESAAFGRLVSAMTLRSGHSGGDT